MSSSIIPIIIETMMTIRTTPMSMKKRRRKTEEEKKETVMKMKNMLEKTSNGVDGCDGGKDNDNEC